MTAYLRVLEQAVADPGVVVGEVEVLDAGERELVVEAWNDTTAASEDRPLGELFEEQVRTRPHATALIFEDEHLTYTELNTRANRIAHHLTATTVRPGDLVGVLLERGTDFAATLIALAKTGAAYTVLDPEFPDERLNRTTTNAHLTTIVTHTRHTHRITTPHTHLITLDTDTPALTRHPTTNPGTPVPPDATACVMFTSGSTGHPKGVQTSHRAIAGTLTHQHYTHFGPHQTYLQCSPTSWDAFALEFWGALLHGATTVLQPGQRPEPALIAQLTTRHRITMLQLSSSLFNYLTDEHPHTFTHVQHAFTGGEPASPTHLTRAQQHHPHLTITNGYGPAETMGFTTTHHLPPDWNGTTVPIGTPITNKHAYILDTHLRPTPIGITGELYLGGIGLAHGYHNQPTTTAQRFIPNPYGPPGTRLYRTGDLAHWTPHGTLHYTGRTDTQIKIRGFRIEPTEIETTLLHHPHITQATVTTWKHPHDNTPRLIAYITTTPHPHDTDSPTLRTWLRTQCQWP